MATAVEPKMSLPSAGASLGLLPASLVGAIVLLAGIGIVGGLVPTLWDSVVGTSRGMTTSFLRIAVILAAIGGLIALGSKFGPANPPVGLRGGIFIVISVIITLFFLIRAVGLNLENASGGAVITGVIAAALLFGAYKFLTSQRCRNWMIGLEEMGFFHTHSFKRTQGLRVRRWTMIGILLLGCSGIYTMISHETLPSGDWKLRLPFLFNEDNTHKTLSLLSDLRYTGPILLIGATIWFAWRVVNMPVFADFLIATEAEMNKVSWTPWRKLVQDTIVVLVTTALLTAFLLIIDLFWGWLLSDIVGVLPGKSALPKPEPAGQSVPW